MQVETTQPNREMPEVPPYAMRVVDALEAAGHEAWVVGGWVRDALMGRPGHDGELDSTVIYLAADESTYVTGNICCCDGGWTAI